MHVFVWVCFMREQARCHNIVGVVSEVKHCYKTDTCYIAPLHTGLDEGKWPFNRHDSHFDWELCPKASTLPASKASQRLCSASSSPVPVVILVCCAMLLLWCPSPHGILRLVSLYRLYRQHLLIHCFWLFSSYYEKSCQYGHDLYKSCMMCLLHCSVKSLPHSQVCVCGRWI